MPKTSDWLDDHDRWFRELIPESSCYSAVVEALLQAEGIESDTVDNAGHSPVDHANAMYRLASKRLAWALEVASDVLGRVITEHDLPLPRNDKGRLDRRLPRLDEMTMSPEDLSLVTAKRSLEVIIQALETHGARSCKPYEADAAQVVRLYHYLPTRN